MGSTLQEIAVSKNLSNVKEFTGHCFQRSSVTLLVDVDGDLMALKRHGGWRLAIVKFSWLVHR